MLTSIAVTALILATLAYGLRSQRSSKSIVRRPYNNRYSDASGAREDHLS
jgi:hypothetical protein